MKIFCYIKRNIIETTIRKEWKIKNIMKKKKINSVNWRKLKQKKTDHREDKSCPEVDSSDIIICLWLTKDFCNLNFIITVLRVDCFIIEISLFYNNALFISLLLSSSAKQTRSKINFDCPRICILTCILCGCTSKINLRIIVKHFSDQVSEHLQMSIFIISLDLLIKKVNKKKIR